MPDVTDTVATSYDALNRPTALLENGTTALASYAYDDLSRRTTVTLGNGTATSYGYSAQSALASLAHNLAGTAQDLTYGYTRDQAQAITALSWSNDAYQWGGGATNGTKTYTANGLNQYTSAAGATLGYDANGNLTGDGVWSYGYDLDHRLTSATKTGLSASLAYDGEGRLTQTTIAGVTTHLLYDGADLLAEYDSSGNLLRRYVHGPGIDEPLVWYEGTGTTQKTWLYGDHLGSIVATADGSGTSTAVYSYGPWGEPNVATGVRFRYTGQQLLGQLNLYHYKARMYSPAIGRFLQTDPIGYGADMNLYAYVGNDPINLTDPSGNCPTCIIGAGLGAGVGLLVQGGLDLYNGRFSSPSEYLAAAVGGAAGGALAGTGCFSCAGAAAGAAANLTRSAIDGNFSAAGLATETAVGAVGGAIGGRVLPAAVSQLSNGAKGAIGEAVARANIFLNGETVIASQRAAREVGTYTGCAGRAIPDFTVRMANGAIGFVEAKFGSSGLTGAQRALLNQAGPDLFRVVRTSYGDIGGFGAGIGGGAVAGAK